MPIRTDHVLVVDIEASCWPGNAAPPGEQSEIIEVGLCLVDSFSGAIEAADSLLVRPSRSKISPFCTELTGLTREQVAGGMEFYEACAQIEARYASPERLWLSWGAFDKRLFTEQCRSFGVPYPFSKYHINLKKMHAKLLDLGKPLGMAKALTHHNLSLEGRHHRGVDDAVNIGRILAALIALKGPGFMGLHRQE